MVAQGYAEFWDAAAAAAIDVPATGSEREAWCARNLCELALALEVFDGPVAVLDQVVSKTQLTASPSRFANRLRGLRERRGHVPDSYPAGVDNPPRSIPPDPLLLACATALLEFAEHLAEADVEPLRESAQLGRGASAVQGRSDWRPFPKPSRPNRFIELDIPSELIWRAWMVLPGLGAVRVVNNERLSDSEFDIWWGVHDGSHLEHIAMFSLDGPSPIEFGSGLLITEALVMSLELLAAAEALVTGAVDVQATVRTGILERVGRIEGVFTDPAMRITAERLGITQDIEFRSVPTIAGSYVKGPLRLMARGFDHPLIPEPIPRNLIRRWAALNGIHPAIDSLLNAARQRTGYA